jgi:hypothetical protein
VAATRARGGEATRMNERWVLALALWSVIGGGLFLCRRKSPLHSVVIVLLSTAVLGVFHPLCSLFVEPMTWRHAAWAPERAVLGAQREYLGFAVGLLLVCGLAWMPGWQGIDAIRVGGRPRLRRHQVEELTRRDLILASSLIVVGGLLYFGYVTRVGLGVLVDRDDYGRKYLLSEGLGVLAVGLILMMAGCLWAEVSPLSRARKAPFRLIALALAIKLMSVT